MRCSHAVHSIRALGGGDVPSADLMSHLETCSACADVLAEHQRTLAAIKALSWPRPRTELIARLQHRGTLHPSAGSDDVVTRSPHAPSPRNARAPRRWRLTDAFAVGVVLAFAGWVYIQRQATVPAASPPASATAAGLASATPEAVATRVGDGGRLTEFRGVAERPIELTVVGAWRQGQDLKCDRVWLEFGDGTSEDLACHDDLPLDAYPGWPSDTTYTVTHAYAAGTYFPQLRMVLQDGSEQVQSAAQVMVFLSPPRSLGAEVVRLRPFPWALGLMVVGVLWLVTRRSRDRWLGLGFALCVANYFGLAFVWPMAMPITNYYGPSGQDNRNSSLLAYLSGLRGQVGLDPLDPVVPLQDYTVETIQRAGDYTYFVTRFTYADGRSRTYLVPIERWRSPTRMDGLGRLRTEHRELPGLPFADLDRDGIALGAPSRLAATSEADQPGVARSWLESGCLVGHGNLVPAPDGTAFLAARRTKQGETSVWHVPIDGRPDRLVGASVYDYQWSPDSRYLAVVKSVDGTEVRVIVQSAGTGSEIEIAPIVGAEARPGVTAHGVWFPQPDGVWTASWERGDLDRVMSWPPGQAYAPTAPRRGNDPTADEGELAPEAALVRPSPDGTRVAYSCRGGLCFANLDGTGLTIVDVRVYEVAWSPDGQQLAAVESVSKESWDGVSPRDPRRLWLIDRDGGQVSIAVAPEGPVSPPAWTADGQRLFLTTCPYDGRRIITVDAATGEARDLSQPRWDAWSALLLSENALLLSNGRGGYWRAGVLEP